MGILSLIQVLALLENNFLLVACIKSPGIVFNTSAALSGKDFIIINYLIAFLYETTAFKFAFTWRCLVFGKENTIILFFNLFQS